jgi:perosamine synthetase
MPSKPARNAQEILDALHRVLPAGQVPIALHEPQFSGNEWKYVKDCLDSGWVSSVGAYVDRLEADLAAYTGAKRAIAVVNGTAALHVCLILAGVEAGDEVLVPALTFVASANAVAYCGAVPHFIDAEEGTLGLDPLRLAAYLAQIAERRQGACYNRGTGRRIKAVVAMHTFGHPVDCDPLIATCRDFGIELVEDAAESLGSLYRGRHTGNFGRVAALSFNGNKIITTGGGGAILTNDEELGARAKHLTTTAKVPHRWQFKHDTVGYNYRMPNINAALGCAQLELLPCLLAQKRALAERYASALAGVAGIRFVSEPANSRSNYWLNALLLDEDLATGRDALLELTNGAGVMTRPAWTLMHQLPMFSGCPHMELPVAEALERRLINIPSSAFLGGESHGQA